MRLIPKNEFPVREKKYWEGIAYTLEKMKKDRITHLVVTMTSAIPYAYVMRELARLKYGKAYRPHFLIYDPGLHPRTHRDHRYSSPREQLYNKQLKRLKAYFDARPNCRVGVFDEAGTGITGKSLRLMQEEISRICGKEIQRYACGKNGVLTSRNATSIFGKIVMREEEFIIAPEAGGRKFFVADIKTNVSRTLRAQFRGLPKEYQVDYTEFRGCWRAIGNSGKTMLNGYRKVAKSIFQTEQRQAQAVDFMSPGE